MARIRYFADLPTGVTIDLGDRIRHDGSIYSSARHFSGFVDGQWIEASRKVEMKSLPSRHQCDDRCINATGKVMKCECSCSGKNHGRGAFMCEAA